MDNYDGLTIGYWSTVALIWVATFCFLVKMAGFWLGITIFFLLFVPLSNLLVIPLAIFGAALGGIIGWFVQLIRRHISCHQS